MMTALAIVILLGTVAGWWLAQPRSRDRRGRRLLTRSQAAKHSAIEEGDITWGGAKLPRGAETTHQLVVGTTGSGKSTLLNRLLLEALGRAEPGSGTRALIYDAKTEMASTLARLELDIPVLYLNPFDERGVDWDMSADITSPASALQVASIFIAEEGGGANRFFTDAARDLLCEVMMAFIDTGADWGLRDVLLTMRSKERLEEVLRKTVRGAETFEMYAGDSRTFQNIVATCRSRLAPFEPVAACWARAKERVSLRDWVDGEMVLVLGNDDSARQAIDCINRVIFQRATELVLSEPNSRTRRTWFFLDEVREAGKLDGLSRLMTKGRSRGAAVCLGFQSVLGMEATYGREVAHEILGQCSQKAFLRMEDESSAKWASATIGQYEQVEIVRGQSGGFARAVNRSANEQYRTADLVMPSELLSIPPTTMEAGLTGYFLTPHVGAWKQTLDLQALLLPGPVEAREVPDIIQRAESDQYLASWQQEDCHRLGLECELEQEQADGELSPLERAKAGALEELRMASPGSWRHEQ